jgi:flavin-dependent dehydrogenase
VVVRAEYRQGTIGRTVSRVDLDVWLLEQAIAAGARFESALVARQPLASIEQGVPVVRGLVLSPRDCPSRISRMPANVVIAADGARSALARQLGLTRTPVRPRRWAYGLYAQGVAGMSDVGEMHVGPSSYLGLAPLTDHVTNICVVTGPRPPSRDPMEVVTRAIAADPQMAARCQGVTFLGRPRVLGPLAVDAHAFGVEGLLLAGDAAGFVDPITGDGLHLAMQGARLAAEQALEALDSSDLADAPRRLADARRRVLGPKIRFNRLVRLLTASPRAIAAASLAATVAPEAIRRLVRYAGDAGRG